MTTSEERARDLWDKIYPRIYHMDDRRKGTHAQFCVHDIAQALREAEARFAGELEAYCFTMMKRMEDQLSAYNNVIMWCRERAQRVREGTP